MKKPSHRTVILSALLGLALTLLLLAPGEDAPSDDLWVTFANNAPVIPITEAREYLRTADPATTRAAIYGSDLYIDRLHSVDAAFDDDLRAGGAPAFANRLPDAPESAGDTEAAWVVRTPLINADSYLSTMIENSSVPIEVHRLPRSTDWTSVAISLAPVLLIIGFFIIFFGRGAGRRLGLSQPYSFARPGELTQGFDCVAGIDAARGELEEIVHFLQNPRAASRLGARIPKGALLVGPPGGGKTLLARALAREAGVSFLSIQASSVSQIFVGAGAKNIRKSFEAARKKAPCIVFIDEIDAMGRRRSSGPGNSGSDEKETTLNQLLVELDGFDSREGIFVVAATNRPDILDDALIRRGRIDRRIDLSLPNRKARSAILGVHFDRVRTGPDFDVDAVSKISIGFSGSDCEALANEAALVATREGADCVTMAHIAAARDRMALGIDSGNILSREERKIVAVHEGGHALAALRTPGADPIEKATILPRGGALGMVVQAPDTDRYFQSLERLEARMTVLAAGRKAEELILGPRQITTGAASDIREITRIATAMVHSWGLSDQGFIALDTRSQVMPGGEGSPSASVRRIVEDMVSRAEDLLASNMPALEAIIDALLEHDTLDLDEIRSIVETAERDSARIDQAIPA